jgi:hypothetical protein
MDEITAVLEREQLRLSIEQLGNTSMRHTKAAAKVTADNIQRESRARARRQLLNPTGTLEAGLVVRDDYAQVGYVVMSLYRDAREMYNVPIWVEKGTRQGKPRSHDAPARPYFWPSVLLEIGAHERRITEAMDQALAEEGLGV